MHAKKKADEQERERLAEELHLTMLEATKAAENARAKRAKAEAARRQAEDLGVAVEKAKGDEVLFHVKKTTINQFFEHLILPIWDLIEGRDEIFLKVKILEVSSAGSREIVKAMSDMTAHGGNGCDCGCGCG